MSINQTGQRVGSPSLFNQGPAQGGETPLNDQYAHTLRNQNRERYNNTKTYSENPAEGRVRIKQISMNFELNY